MINIVLRQNHVAVPVLIRDTTNRSNGAYNTRSPITQSSRLGYRFISFLPMFPISIRFYATPRII